MQDFVCVEVRAPDAETAEIVAAEAFAAGALGLEEREEDAGIILILYVAAADAETMRRHIGALGLARSSSLSVSAARALPDTNWSEAWKE